MNRSSGKRRKSRHALMESAADTVRTAYILERRTYGNGTYEPSTYWDGGKQLRNGDRRQPVWPKIVETLIELGISDVGAFVHAVFAGWWEMKTVPQPNQLTSDRSLAYWRQSHDDRDGVIAGLKGVLYSTNALFESELHALGKPKGWTLEHRMSSILLGDEYELSSLFRYCVGARYKLAAVKKKYHDAALAKYLMSMTVYDEAWGDVIPTSLKKVAEEFRLVLE